MRSHGAFGAVVDVGARMFVGGARLSTSAPSLISSPNRSFNTSPNRASGMPWTARR